MELWVSKETSYREKTPLIINGTHTRVFANGITIGASALSRCAIARIHYLIAVAVRVIVTEADLARPAYE